MRAIAARLGRSVAVMGDLQGPKIRVARFENKQILLQEGKLFMLSNSHPKEQGNIGIVGID